MIAITEQRCLTGLIGRFFAKQDNRSSARLPTPQETGTATGGAFTQTVTGAESYTGSFTGNTANQEEVGTLTGAGTWTRTSSGAGSTKPSGSGTNSYSHVTSANPIAGVFGQTLTGETRYQLVQSFDDVSNAKAGANPGHVKFRSHGLMFRDPILFARFPIPAPPTAPPRPPTLPETSNQRGYYLSQQNATPNAESREFDRRLKNYEAEINDPNQRFGGTLVAKKPPSTLGKKDKYYYATTVDKSFITESQIAAIIDKRDANTVGITIVGDKIVFSVPTRSHYKATFSYAGAPRWTIVEGFSNGYTYYISTIDAEKFKAASSEERLQMFRDAYNSSKLMINRDPDFKQTDDIAEKLNQSRMESAYLLVHYKKTELAKQYLADLMKMTNGTNSDPDTFGPGKLATEILVSTNGTDDPDKLKSEINELLDQFERTKNLQDREELLRRLQNRHDRLNNLGSGRKQHTLTSDGEY